jgi:hypothetical protein
MFFPGRSTIWSFLVVLAVFWIVGCGQKKGDGGKTPDPLPESILSEWRKAGFQSGWFSKDERGYLHFGAGSPKAGDVPGFTIETWPKGGLVAKLTPPPQPFGVHLHNTTGVTNDTLKELAGMKELQVLTLGRSVGDESTKELAGMTGLQTLDLSTSKVSDAWPAMAAPRRCAGDRYGSEGTGWPEGAEMVALL